MNTKNNIHTFGINLKTIREKKGYTQTKLAEISGVSRRAIVHYENHAKKPAFDKVKKLAEALEISIDELFGIANSPVKNKKKNEDLSYKIMKKVRIIEELPTRDQTTIFSLINALAEKNKIKKNKKQSFQTPTQ